MKKICRIIKLRKLKTKLNEISLKNINDGDFIVCFDNGKWEQCYDKIELRYLIEKDHINKITCIFDRKDRIILDRDVLIDTDNI